MEQFFTPFSIFVTTVSGFLVGAVWFSPILFMKAWLRGEGITKEHVPSRTTTYMAQVNFYSFIAHGAMASVLAVLFDVLAVNSLALALTLGLLITFGFIITSSFIDMVYTPKGRHYDSQSQIKFLVRAGYYLTVVAMMSAVLFFVAHS
jgi:hypothetical protein